MEKLDWILTAGVAFLGYMVTNWVTWTLARRKDRLERINNQLQHCYGPLHALLEANHQAWLDFRSEHHPGDGPYFDADIAPSREDILAWRHYMKHIFMPANERIYEIVVSRSDLLAGDMIPSSLMKLVSHIVSYRAVVSKWGENLDSDLLHNNLTQFDYPAEVQDHVAKEFSRLKHDQQHLLKKKIFSFR